MTGSISLAFEYLPIPSCIIVESRIHTILLQLAHDFTQLYRMVDWMGVGQVDARSLFRFLTSLGYECTQRQCATLMDFIDRRVHFYALSLAHFPPCCLHVCIRVCVGCQPSSLSLSRLSNAFASLCLCNRIFIHAPLKLQHHTLCLAEFRLLCAPAVVPFEPLLVLFVSRSLSHPCSSEEEDRPPSFGPKDLRVFLDKFLPRHTRRRRSTAA